MSTPNPQSPHPKALVPRPISRVCRHELLTVSCSLCCGPSLKHRNDQDYPRDEAIAAKLEDEDLALECMAGGDYITQGDRIVPFYPGWAHSECLQEAQARAEGVTG